MAARRRDAPRVGVVTDSTACLPDELVAALGGTLAVVPLTVTIDGRSLVEGEGVTGETVAQAEQNERELSTARPAPARMVEAFEYLAGQGCTEIVSVHAAAQLSSTVSSARLAAAESPVPVSVVDSTTMGMAMGFAALAGARSAVRGEGFAAVEEVIRSVATTSRTALYVDSLEPLRRGGRVGRAGALFGSALSIKPLLRLEDGVIEPLARVRTTGKAIERLGRWALAEARALGPGPVVCAVHSVTRQDLAERLTGLLTESAEKDTDGAEPVTWAEPIVQAPLAAAVTAHIGSGAIGVAVARMPEDSSGADPNGETDAA